MYIHLLLPRWIGNYLGQTLLWAWDHNHPKTKNFSKEITPEYNKREE